MSEVAVRVQGLGKQYRLGARQTTAYRTLRESLMHGLRVPLGWGRKRAHLEQPLDFWALKDVTFNVDEGEVLGIVGRNGAGKSTLLKILSRITEPTTGGADVYGHVGSLLEVGTGFHPELSGRENIFLSGAILGMSVVDIRRRFDEIVAFSEIEQFLDTPVKRYSSGMYMRLAFSIAAHLEPEILVIDEVLAVGDQEFQKKCISKMNQVAVEGRTVLFVSHNMDAIQRVCHTCLILDRGHLQSIGPAASQVADYLAMALPANPSWLRQRLPRSSDELTFDRIEVLNARGCTVAILAANESASVQISYTVSRPLSACQIAIRIVRDDGLVVLTTGDTDVLGVSAIARQPGSYVATCIIPDRLLAPGRYQCVIAAHAPGRAMYDYLDPAVAFEVSVLHSPASLDDRQGIVAPLLQWTTQPQGLDD